MGVPCDKTEIINMINDTVKETRQDVKETRQDVRNLLAFKDKALGIVFTVTIVFQVVAFLITKVIK